MADDDNDGYDGSASVYEQMAAQEMYPANWSGVGGGGTGGWPIHSKLVSGKKWKMPSSFKIVSSMGLAIAVGYLAAAGTYCIFDKHSLPSYVDPGSEFGKYARRIEEEHRTNLNRAGLVGIIIAGSALFAGFRLFGKKE